MITADAGQTAQFSASVRGAALLIDLDFDGGAQYVTNFSSSITANGHQYTALGDLIGIGAMRESEVLSTEKMKLTLSVVNPAMLGYLIGPASVYRNRDVRIYLQLLNDAWLPVEDPLLRWTGIMDKVSVHRKTSQTGKSGGSIELECQRTGLSRFRNEIGLRMSHAQQQLDYPGDFGLEYTDALASAPPTWLTKRFQEQ